MKKQMKGSIYFKPEKVSFQKLIIPTVEAKQALIKIKRVGICGTDLSIYKGKHPRAKPPLVMGHEIVGELVELGPNCTTKIQIGEFVSINPLYWCGKCKPCINGNNHICESLKLIGIDKDGGFADFCVVEEEKLHILSSSNNWDQAALCEPLAVGVHAIRKSSFRIGDDVTIVGAGVIGVIIGVLLKNYGAKNVKILDVNSWRLEKSIQLGLNAIHSKDILIGSEKSDIVFECSGNLSSYESLTKLVNNSGEIVFVGIPIMPVALSVQDMVFREITTKSVRVYSNDEFAIATTLINDKKIDISQIVTNIIPLKNLSEGFDIMQKGQCLKVVVNPEL